MTEGGQLPVSLPNTKPLGDPETPLVRLLKPNTYKKVSDSPETQSTKSCSVPQQPKTAHIMLRSVDKEKATGPFFLTDGTQGHRCKVCVLAAQSAWIAWEVARCLQKHARDKSNSWVWLLGITGECQTYRYSESSCLAQQPKPMRRGRRGILRARMDHQSPQSDTCFRCNLKTPHRARRALFSYS